MAPSTNQELLPHSTRSLIQDILFSNKPFLFFAPLFFLKLTPMEVASALNTKLFNPVASQANVIIMSIERRKSPSSLL